MHPRAALSSWVMSFKSGAYDVASSNMLKSGVSEDVLKIAADSIRGELGTLQDLPRELANTVANIYYRQVALLYAANGRRHLLDPFIGQPSNSFLDDFKKLANLQAESLAASQTTKTFIDALRDMRKGVNSPKAKAIYDYMIVLTLDIMKYEITKASDKTPIRRAVERKFKTPREIANLVDLMDAAGYAIFTPAPPQ